MKTEKKKSKMSLIDKVEADRSVVHECNIFMELKDNIAN